MNRKFESINELVEFIEKQARERIEKIKEKAESHENIKKET